MPRRDVRALLHDILQAGDFIAADAVHLDLNAYLANRTSRQAIEAICLPSARR